MAAVDMFVDEAEIYVKAGDGGCGCAGFRREKFEPMGGPDGGDGGDGGDVILRAVSHIDTLMDFAGRHHYRAENGKPGEGGERHGRSGRDLIVEMPIGTVVYDRDTGVMLKDLSVNGQQCVIAAGGRGGRGNRSFATATQQAPTTFEHGQRGEERNLKLELKLIADVGLVGLPNAGKSTLLSRLSKARPKIGAYPFTTLSPQLGIVELSGDRRIVVADIPGLIEGAHTGAGLGDAFLRHIERTRIIVHLIDLCPIDGTIPAAGYRTIRRELQQYSPTLAAKVELVVGTKLDLAGSDEPISQLADEIDRPVLGISAATGRGLGELTEAMWRQLEPCRESQETRVDLGQPPHLRETT